MKYRSILALTAALGIAGAGPAFAQTRSSNNPTQSTNQPTTGSFTNNPRTGSSLLPDASGYTPGRNPRTDTTQNPAPRNVDPSAGQMLDNRDSTYSGQSTTTRP
jgi:hypothetical protein